jgi:Lectin C-type domain
VLLAASVATVAVSHVERRAAQTPLQRAWLEFPFLTPATNRDGQPVFQTLALTNAVEIGSTNYFGFRFRVPRRQSQQDFVWSFVLPDYQGLKSWYILPRTGTMEGFSNYFYTERNFFPAEDDLKPADGFRLILQSLSGGALDDGKTYLIWFAFKGRIPAHMSVAFTFANTQEDSLNAFAQALALNSQDYLKQPLSPPIENPDNHHLYILLRPATWEAAEAEAAALGGHLATVRNQAEEDWLFKTFGNYEGMQRLLWIGLSDREKKFHFSWSSGESVSYTDWAIGYNRAGLRGSDYATILYPNHDQANKWIDWADRVVDPIGLPMDGVVEIIPKDTNAVANAKTSAGQPATNAVQINLGTVASSHGASITLQWPVSASGDVLETSTNSSGPFDLFGYSAQTNTEAGVFFATITNPVPQMFFQLQEP